VLDTEDLAPGVRVRVEVQQPDGPTAFDERRDAGLGDRVDPAERDRHRARVDHVADDAGDRRV
jgi:hypothetical protein